MILVKSDPSPEMGLVSLLCSVFTSSSASNLYLHELLKHLEEGGDVYCVLALGFLLREEIWFVSLSLNTKATLSESMSSFLNISSDLLKQSLTQLI